MMPTPTLNLSAPSFNNQQAMVMIGVAASLAEEVPDTALSRDEVAHHLDEVFGHTLAPAHATAVIDFALQYVRCAHFDLAQVVTRAADALDPELREHAFAFACHVALTTSAHVITSTKRAFICTLARSLHLSPHIMGEILRHALLQCRVPEGPLSALEGGPDHAGRAVSLHS